MPRPPILPTIDWPAVFAAGLPFVDWLATGENRETLKADVDTFCLTSTDDGFCKALPRRVHVVAIAEDWCGDVVRHVPPLQAMAHAASNLEVRYISREQFPDVFARYLTNGGEAIPKFIFLNDNFVECGNWGPMPEACKAFIARGKACGDVATARQHVSAYYQADTQRLQVVRELRHLLEVATASTP